MNKEEMKSIQKSMVVQDQRLADALESCRQIRMEAERMEKAYSAARAETMCMQQRFIPIDRIHQTKEGEKAMTEEDLKLAAKAGKDDQPLTAEERLSKYGMIPTRIETEDGLWETFGDYKGNETLVGFRIKKDHPFGPLGDHCSAIVMTVEDWHSVCDQMDMAMSMMKL